MAVLGNNWLEEETALDETNMAAPLETSNGQRHESPRRWSDLPIDILRLIMERRCLVDQIRLHVVCKSWHCVPCIDNFPSLMTYRWDKVSGHNVLISVCRFSGPSLDQTYTLDHIYEEEMEDLIGADLLASKEGWLLLKKTEFPFFLYSPFRREIFELPSLNIGSSRATFSSTPTSPDCTIFAVESSKNSDVIIINTCSRNDTEWRTYIFDSLFKDVKDVVYSNGTLYCVYNGGVLGAFYIAVNDWSILTKSQPIDLERLSSHESEFHMVESDGVLVLVCFPYPLLIFIFDWSTMGWVKESRLGNRAVFIDKTSFAVSAVGKTRNLANRIYYHGDWYTWFYSLETCKHQLCNEYFPEAVEGRFKRVWIEPWAFG